MSFLFATELEIESTRLWEEADARSKVGINNKFMIVNDLTKRANLAYLKEAVKNGYRMSVALEYDGNYYYRVRVHEADATVMFLMYLNAEVYATVQRMLGCQTILSVATGRFTLSHAHSLVAFRGMSPLKMRMLHVLNFFYKNVSPAYAR